MFLLFAGCTKKDTDNAGTSRIHRISQEDKSGILQYVFELSYNADGTVSEMLITDQTRYAKKFLYSHTQNTSTRRYLNENGTVQDLDSTLINAAGKPLALYQSQNRKWMLQKRFDYGPDGLLTRVGIPVNSNPDSVYYLICRHEGGDLVRVENPNSLSLSDEVYTYYPGKPSVAGGALMLGVLFSRGRILFPYNHLLKSYESESGGVRVDYEYTWEGGRIATFRTRVDGVTETVQRITYEK